MKTYKVIYKYAYSIIVKADSSAEALCKADEYDNDEMEYIDFPPEVNCIGGDE